SRSLDLRDVEVIGGAEHIRPHRVDRDHLGLLSGTRRRTMAAWTAAAIDVSIERPIARPAGREPKVTTTRARRPARVAGPLGTGDRRWGGRKVLLENHLGGPRWQHSKPGTGP